MKNLRWGIISTADIGMAKVIPAMQRAERCEVVGIASRGRDRAAAAATRLGIPLAFGSYEELLASDEIDAVYIPLPNDLHAQWTIKAAEAGKHVLCEKPLAMSAAQAEEMVRACATAGVVLAEAFMYRLHPTWAEIMRLARGGAIGSLQAVQSYFGYHNDDPANIRNRVENGGGAIMDVGCYCVNLSRMLFASEPTRVQSTVRRDPEMGIDVVASALLEFPGGGQSAFTCSTRAEPFQGVHIFGTAGRIEADIPFNIPPDREARVFVTRRGKRETLTFPAADQYSIQAALFAGAVLDGTPMPVPIEDAIANMRVIEAILS